jgi:hypothetical protein
MSVSFARPDVTDMVLRVFDRSVHPELLQTVGDSQFDVGSCRISLRLCRDGHAIEFRAGNRSVTETAVSRHLELPHFGRLISRRLIGYRTHEFRAGCIQYFCSYQLEQIAPELFLDLHRELQMDARRAPLAVEFPGVSSASPGSLSFLQSDRLKNGVIVHSFHTFPGNAAILRIQSLFEYVGH